MKYLSLFSGIGGFELGIQQAYETKNSGLVNSGGQMDSVSRRQEAEHSAGVGDTHAELLRDESDQSIPICIGYSEIDKYAVSIYQKHFPTHKNYGDITQIDTADLPDFDLLVGGFPCQAFSIAGKRAGFADTRGTLFFEIARILAAKQPTRFILENVKGLLSHDGGNTFKTIIATIDELGYDVQWQVLNSKNHGVPQNRERVYFVGHLRGTPRPKVFPLGESNGDPQTGNQQREGIFAGTVTARYNSRNGRGTHILQQVGVLGKDSEATRVYDPQGIARTIKNGGGMGAKTGLYEIGQEVRRLTPTECERLQGFPDGWTKVGTDWNYGIDGEVTGGAWIDMSDTQRYKMCGNAVTTNVIRDVVKAMQNQN